MRTTRGRFMHSVVVSAVISALFGAIISVIVNNALIESTRRGSRTADSWLIPYYSPIT